MVKMKIGKKYITDGSTSKVKNNHKKLIFMILIPLIVIIISGSFIFLGYQHSNQCKIMENGLRTEESVIKAKTDWMNKNVTIKGYLQYAVEVPSNGESIYYIGISSDEEAENGVKISCESNDNKIFEKANKMSENKKSGGSAEKVTVKGKVTGVNGEFYTIAIDSLH